MPPDISLSLKIIFLISQRKIYVVGTQKNRLDETVLLGAQNKCMFKLMGENILTLVLSIHFLMSTHGVGTNAIIN